MAVDMKEIIKVSPTTPRPYPHMRCYMGSKGEEYFEEITRQRALAILEAGYTLDLIKGDSGREALTKDYLLNTETAAAAIVAEVRTLEEEAVEETATPEVEVEPAKAKRK